MLGAMQQILLDESKRMSSEHKNYHLQGCSASSEQRYDSLQRTMHLANREKHICRSEPVRGLYVATSMVRAYNGALLWPQIGVAKSVSAQKGAMQSIGPARR